MTAVLMLLMAGDPSGIDESGVLLLDFTAGYCQPCQQMLPLLRRMEHDGFPIRQIDITEEHSLSRQYNVERIPTLVLLVNGREVKRFVGLTAEAELRREMNNAARALRPPLREEAAAAPPRTADASTTPPAAAPRRGGLLGYFSQRLSDFLGTAVTPEDVTIRGQDPESGRGPSDALVSAFAATVRIRVHDSRREDTGSGTVIHSAAGGSYILTCAHLFTGFAEDAAVEVDVFGNAQAKRFPATVVGGDHNSDLAIIRIQNADPLTHVQLSARPAEIALQQNLYSFGCNKGDVPTPMQTKVSKISPYLGPANLTCDIPPEKGRSGGGLFNDEGQLIGVCSAADPARNEGLYMAHNAVMSIISHCRLQQLVEGTIELQPTQSRGVITDRQTAQQDVAQQNPFDTNQPPAEAPESLLPTSNPQGNAAPADAASMTALKQGPEITVVIDPKTPGGEKRVIVIPQASAWLVDMITGEGASTQDLTVATN